ncbi:MAG: helix-turn-helix domain-containing protein [Eubacterium sp.]
MANNKHLSLSDRITIESMLEKHHTFKEIGSFLDKDPTTISKEIRSALLLYGPVAGTYSTITVSYGSPVPKTSLSPLSFFPQI